MNKPLIVISALLAAIFLLGSGCVDIDWMIVSYRFSEWHRLQQTWEFCPWLILGWWDAYAFTLGRIILGSGLLGGVTVYVYMTLSSKK